MKNAIRNPDWWLVLLTFIEVVVLTMLTYVLTWQKEQREDNTLAAQLESDEASEYEPAAYDLTQHRHGMEKIQVYDDKQAGASGEVCTPWKKAVFLQSLINRFQITEEHRRSSLKVIWAAWNCNKADLGMDVQLFEFLKADPIVGCSLIVDKLPNNLAMFRKAAILYILEDLCPKHGSPTLEKWQEAIGHCAGADPPEKGKPHVTVMCLEFGIAYPWPSANKPGPSYAVRDEASWGTVVLGLSSLVTKAGPNGNAVMWQALQSEPLWSKIVFASFLLGESKNPANSLREREETSRAMQQLSDWVDLGLHAQDSYSKLAALGAIYNRNLPEPKQLIRSIALDDPDPGVRREAGRVLDSMP
jgi:hypothetical protein